MERISYLLASVQRCLFPYLRTAPNAFGARAFVARAFYNIPTTGALLERLRREKTFRQLCGWERSRPVGSSYKFTVDVGDGGIPLSAITTSASVHDSQVAIPLMKMTSDRVESLYDSHDL